MNVSSITLRGDKEVTIKQNGSDVYVEGTIIGVPGDAGDHFIWKFCSDVHKRLYHIQPAVPIEVEVAKIYAALESMFRQAEADQMAADEFMEEHELAEEPYGWEESRRCRYEIWRKKDDDTLWGIAEHTTTDVILLPEKYLEEDRLRSYHGRRPSYDFGEVSVVVNKEEFFEKYVRTGRKYM